MIKRFLNSDVNLIRRLRKSDQHAFEFVYNKFKEKLYYFTRRYLHSTVETEEIIQKVFISLWENRDNLKEEYSLSGLLYKTTINQIYNYFKHEAVRQKYLDHLLTRESPQADDLQQRILHNDLQVILDRLVEEMPEKQQFIFRLSRLEGLSNIEIAKRLGLSVRSVENHIYRALKHIKVRLRKDYQLTE